MLQRLLRYPYANARARALATAFAGPSVLTSLVEASGRAGAAEALDLPNVPHGEADRRLIGEYLRLAKRIAHSLPPAAGRVIWAYRERPAVENLKTLCRALLTGRPAETAGKRLLPGDFPRLLPADLSAASDLAGLVDLLPPSPYRRVVRQALLLRPEECLFRLETDLDRAFWNTLAARLASLSFFDRQAAREILGLRADLDRLRIVVRGWRESLPPGQVAAALPPLGSLFPRDRVRRALAAEEPETALRRLLPAVGGEDLLGAAGERLLQRRLYRELRRILRSPPFDLSIPLAVVLLKELETGDLQTVLEGLHFGAGKDGIVSRLIMHED